jgi:two-component system chemotaxis response regulator CheY
MALETTLRRFVAYAPTSWAPRPRSEGRGGIGGGRTKLAPSPSADTAGWSGGGDDVEGTRGTGTEGPGTEDMVRVPVETGQMSADVLVVDDDADVRWTVAEILRSAGFTVAEAEDGEIALDLLGTGRYRMILLDMRMPRRDGVSLIEAIGDVPPVIVHSAYALGAADRERLGTSVVDVLHKPVSPQKLLRAVDAALGPRP